MNTKAELESVNFRPAAEGDQAALENFSCSQGAGHEDVVEDHIRV